MKDMTLSSIPSGAQYLTLQKYFSHPSFFFFFFFSNPIYTTKTRTANRWEITNSKPLGPIIMIGRSETRSSSQIIFIKLSLASVRLCCAFYQRQQTLQKCWIKTILLSQTQHVLTFLCPILMSKVTY